VFGYALHEKPIGTDLTGIDFVQLAEAQGVHASRVEDPTQLQSSILAALSVDRPYLLEIIIA